MNLIPNVSSDTFSLSAVIVGYLLIDKSTAKEQNALGNWFMLVGQLLCTNASHQQVKEERIIGNPLNINDPNSAGVNSTETINTPETLQKIRDAINNGLEFYGK